jgi:hypothetical protein
MPLNGDIFYRSGFGVRSASIWSSPSGRRDVHRLAIFKALPRRRWAFEIRGRSTLGEFSSRISAADPPLIGIPKLQGTVTASTLKIASVLCDPLLATLISIHAEDATFHLSMAKTVLSDEESDVVLTESKHGELAIIRIREFSMQELLKSRFGFGLCRRGAFKHIDNALACDERFAQCVITSLCLYFSFLEPLRNTTYPSS